MIWLENQDTDLLALPMTLPGSLVYLVISRVSLSSYLQVRVIVMSNEKQPSALLFAPLHDGLVTDAKRLPALVRETVVSLQRHLIGVGVLRDAQSERESSIRDFIWSSANPGHQAEQLLAWMFSLKDDLLITPTFSNRFTLQVDAPSGCRRLKFSSLSSYPYLINARIDNNKTFKDIEFLNVPPQVRTVEITADQESIPASHQYKYSLLQIAVRKECLVMEVVPESTIPTIQACFMVLLVYLLVLRKLQKKILSSF